MGDHHQRSLTLRMDFNFNFKVRFENPFTLKVEGCQAMGSQLTQIQKIVAYNATQLRTIHMNINEAITIIKDTKTQLEKAKAEILKKIDDLETAPGTLTPEQEAAITELKTAAQVLDDVVPDAPPIDPVA